jgi:hypothetical protein
MIQKYLVFVHEYLLYFLCYSWFSLYSFVIQTDLVVCETAHVLVYFFVVFWIVSFAYFGVQLHYELLIINLLKNLI